MATATKINDLNGAAEQVSDFNQRLIQASKSAGSSYLDSYEKLVENMTGLQQKLADQSHVEAVQTVVSSQVDLTRQLTSAFTSAAREFTA